MRELRGIYVDVQKAGTQYLSLFFVHQNKVIHYFDIFENNDESLSKSTFRKRFWAKLQFNILKNGFDVY